MEAPAFRPSSSKMRRSLTKRYHVALQPPCDCWTFGARLIVEQRRSVNPKLSRSSTPGSMPSRPTTPGSCRASACSVSRWTTALVRQASVVGGCGTRGWRASTSLPPTARKRNSSVRGRPRSGLRRRETQLRFVIQASRMTTHLRQHLDAFSETSLVAALDRAFLGSSRARTSP